MQNYLLIYHAGFDPITPDDFNAAQPAWDEWFTELGEAVIDRGNPLTSNQTVGGDKSENRGSGKNPAVRYTLVQAEDREAVVALAKKCPLIDAGGDIQIAEITPSA